MRAIGQLFVTGWEHAQGSRGRIALYAVLSTGALIATLAEPLVIGRMLDGVQAVLEGQGEPRTVYAWLGAFVALWLTFWALHGPSRVIERTLAFHIRTRFEVSLLRTVVGLPLQWHRDHHSGETIAKVNRASLALGGFWEDSFELIHIVSRFLGSFVILTFFLPAAGAVAAVISLAAVFIIHAFDQRLVALTIRLNALLDRVASAVHDYVTNVTTVITLRVGGNVTDEVLARRQAALPVARREIALNELKWFSATLTITFVVVTLFAWYSARELTPGTAIKVGAFFTFFEYLRRMGDSCYGLALRYGMVVKQGIDLRGVDDLRALDRPTAVPDAAQLLPAPRRVDVSGLSFTYEDEERRTQHLDDVALTLELGKAVAVIGASGSGKSTLLRVLRVLHTPAAVEVRCDGATSPVGLAAVTHHATLIPQDPEIFADTIRFNVTFGLPAAEADVLDAIRVARFEEALARLPRGLDTNIAEKGVNLSGGEKQRLALARGVLFAVQSEIVLLDEPTSSVDPHNEQLIYKALLGRFRDRAVVCALHRLHLLPLFDHVLVLEDGRVVESGAPSALAVSGSGPFARLWASYRVSDDAVRGEA